MAGFKSEVPRRRLPAHHGGRRVRRALKEPPLPAGRDLPSGQEPDRLTRCDGVCVERIVAKAVALLVAECRAHATVARIACAYVQFL